MALRNRKNILQRWTTVKHHRSVQTRKGLDQTASWVKVFLSDFKSELWKASLDVFATLQGINKGDMKLCELKLCLHEDPLLGSRATDPLQGKWRAEARLSRESHAFTIRVVNNSFLTESSVLNTGFRAQLCPRFTIVRGTSQPITKLEHLRHYCWKRQEKLLW